MIERKKKICVECDKETYLFSGGRCKPCAQKISILLKQGTKVEKKETISSMVKELDTIFSTWIRLRYADKDGIVVCYTSDKPMHYRKAQAGHFISRKHYATRWSDVNVQVQSVRENIFSQGNAPEFGKRLATQYGKQAVDNLFLLRDMPYKLDRLNLRYMIQDYSEKVVILKAKLNIE